MLSFRSALSDSRIRSLTVAVLCPPCPDWLLRRLAHSDYPIGRDVFELLNNSRRPPDLYQACGFCRSEFKVGGSGAGGCIAGRERHEVILRDRADGDPDSGSDAVAIALSAFQPKIQPMRAARTIVGPHFRGRTQGSHHDID